ncbi:MAG: hypothetical protein IKF90_24580 [Parasporobacterium sp.]|nr:hypothetical protein [Parasporobacterium sp.]
MRNNIYYLLVNRQSGIALRYHAYHDGSVGFKRILSYLYLFWLNFAYYVLQIKSLGTVRGREIYENKKLLTSSSESEAWRKKNPELSVEHYVQLLSSYDVISFDIFDTLIFRPFERPVDLFLILEEKLEILDFQGLRISSEAEAREQCVKQNGHGEIGFSEIWEMLSRKIAPGEDAMQKELELEEKLCYANPFMLEVWKKLAEAGKRIIVISDMYLPGSFLETILRKNGFTGYEKLYVSNEYKKSKADGTLYGLVKNELEEKYGEGLQLIHVGDNVISDGRMAEKNGFKSLLYPKTNARSVEYRTWDQSELIGSSYRGIVEQHLYNGLRAYDMTYEYGFIYGGIFALGYCQFVHDYCSKNEIDRILFLSRDGDILQQVYALMYPEDKTEYVYWSRKTATKLIAELDRHDYFRRFLFHKVNQNITVSEILDSMELENLKSVLQSDDNCPVALNDRLETNNVRTLQQFLEEHWDQIKEAYKDQLSAAEKYYRRVLSGARKCVAVDVGWAGSGALSLRYLTSQVWKLPCEIIGLLAGTCTPFDVEPDYSEPFLQSGKLVSYLFSQSFNRDLLKKHDPHKDYNVFFELLLSSLQPNFQGFYEGKRENGADLYDQELDITLGFGSCDPNPEGIRNIQQGILDFTALYLEHFRDIPYMLNISGRNAYAPILAAAGRNESYLKTIEKKFGLEINVN